MRWYAIQIYPQFRDLAKQHLDRQGYRNFFAERISNNVTEPLFKGYGFVCFDIERHRWTPINSTRGVVRLLPSKSLVPIPLPHGFVEDLIDRDPVSDADLYQTLTSYCPGDPVEVTQGVMRGQRGEVVALRNRSEIEIIFPLVSVLKLCVISRDNVRPGAPI